MSLTRRQVLASATAAIASSIAACGPWITTADEIAALPAGAATIIVAEIVQRLSGRSIHEFVRREILEPLGLRPLTSAGRT